MKLDFYDCDCFVYVAKENIEEVKSYLEQRNVDYIYIGFGDSVEFGCVGTERNAKIFDNIGKRFSKPIDKSKEM